MMSYVEMRGDVGGRRGLLVADLGGFV